MKTQATRQRRRSLAALTSVGVALSLGLIAAAGALAFRTEAPGSQLQRALPLPKAGAVAGIAQHAKAPQRRQMPRPVRISIPAIRVSAPVVPLGLNRDRTLQVPRIFSQTGWFVGGPEPGEYGAAVIVGHVDSKSGPAVFYRLRALRRGDAITVVLKSGAKVRFVVRGMRQVPKKRFPTKLVYGKTGLPTLRLITCDGAFDRSTGHYVGNYIVFASQA